MRPLGLYSTEEDSDEIDVELRRTRFDRLYPEPEPEPILPEPVQAPPPPAPAAVVPAPAPPLPVVDPRAERMAAFESKWGSPAQERAERTATFASKWGPQSNSVLERYVTAPQTPEALDATVARVASSPAPQAGLTGDIVPNQFDSGLSTEDALAACGPAAAVAFARATGRNPTVAEARNLAAEVGWTPQRGMAGPRSQKALLDKMGVPALLTEGAPDWGRVRADVESGNPVTISTPGHYFVAAGFDPETGRFDFGHSGTALRGGKRWMTPAELGQTGMGQPHATLYLDNPDTPQSSTAARGGGQYRETDEGIAAQKYGLDPDIFFRQISQESGGKATAVSPAGARGVGQFMPATAAGVAQRMGGGVTAEQIMSDKAVGLDAAAFHMRELLDQYGGDYATALSAYNAGPGAVAKYGGPPPFAETQTYIAKILGNERPIAAPVRETYEDVVARNRPTRTVALRTAPEPVEAPPAPEPEPEPVRLTGDVDRGFTGIPQLNEPTPTNPFERVGRALVDALKGVPELAGQVPEPIREAAGAGVAALPGIGAFTRPEVREAAGTALEAARAVTPTSIAARTVAGEEQIANESRAEYTALLEAMQRYGPDSAEAETAAETYNQAAARARAEGVYAAAERNPSLLPAELTAGIAGGLAAGVVAPTAAAGVARNVAASVLDPTQGLFNVVGPTARALGRVGRAAEEVPVTVPPLGSAEYRARVGRLPAAAEPLALPPGRSVFEPPPAAASETPEAAAEAQRMYSGIPIPTPRFTRGAQQGIPAGGLGPEEEAILSSAGQPTPRVPSAGINPPRFLRRELVSADAALSDAQKLVERDYLAATPGARQLPEQLRAVELRRMESGSTRRAELRVQDLKDAYRLAEQAIPALEKALEYGDDLDKAAAVARRSGQEVADARVFSGGRTVAQSREGLRLLEQQLPAEQWAAVQRAGEEVYRYVDGLRERLVQSGVWSPEFADQMRREFPHYIPTRIWEYMDDPQFVAAGRKIGLSENGVHYLTEAGTERARENVTDSLVRLSYETEKRAARNETARGVFGWRDVSPELADLMREVPDDYKATKQEVKHTFFDEGTKRTVAVDKSFADALEIKPHQPYGLFSWPAAVLRATATERNPLFAIAGNPLLDLPTAGIHTAALYGPQKLPVFVYELIRALPDVFAGLTENRISGPGLRQLFGSGGGQLGYFSGRAEDVARMAREVRAGGGFVVTSPADVARFVWDLTPAIGTRMENVGRVAAMRMAERAGVDQMTVTIRGRSATMDFSEGGKFTKVLSNYVPFFNISTRPIPWLLNTAKQNPKAATATLVTGMAGVAGVEAWNRSDPARADAYENVPDYVKNQGVIIMMPEATQEGRDEQGRPKLNYVVFPLRNFSPIVIPTRMAIERMMGDATPQEWEEALKGIIGTSSPIQTDSGTAAVGNFVPNILGTALQLADNKDFFRNTQIATEYADERATYLSKGISSLPGVQGRVRPSQVEFAARDVGAGVAGIVLAGIDMATKAVKGEPTEPLNPALGERRFTGGIAGRFVRHQGGQVDRDLAAAREQMRDQLLSEVRADPRWATKSPQQQDAVERRIGEFATKVTFGTQTNPATILRNAQEYLRFKGATPEEMSAELAKLREALKEREEKAAPRRETVRRELAGTRS